jgi:hypothetical protein
MARQGTVAHGQPPGGGGRAGGARRRPRSPMLGMEIDRTEWPAAPLLALAAVLAGYHRHRVEHLERLGRVLRAGRRVIVVGNHALDVVDPLLFIAAVLERYGRVPRIIGHKSWFRLPLLRELSARYRVVPSRDMEAAARALVDDGFLMLFPGGVAEAAVRSYREEPYRLKWEDRDGFLKLALVHDAEVIFVAAVGNEEMYYQSRLQTPAAVVRLADAGDGTRYRGAPLRFGLLGAHLVPGVCPLPVQLTHVVSPPLPLGDRTLALRDPAAFARLHRAVWRRCQTFLARAVARREHSAGLADRTIRAGERLLQQLGL